MRALTCTWSLRRTENKPGSTSDWPRTSEQKYVFTRRRLTRNMVKIYIDEEEWHPVFYLEKKGCGKEAEVSEEEHAEIKRVFEEFDKVQEKLRVLFRNKE